jgi:uncharacterized membrane protein YkvI
LVANLAKMAEVLLPLANPWHVPPRAGHEQQEEAGGTTMPVIALLSAVFVVGFEQLVQWQYGPMGIVGLLLLSIGIKAKSPTCSSIGAVMLALMVAGPAL